MTAMTTRREITRGLLAAVLLAVPAVAAGQTAGAVYTAAQAAAGRAVYERECAECHQTNLQGSFEAPPLAGESFLRFWGDLAPSDLYDRISSSMPPEQPDSLGEAAYVDVVAYLLQANGAPAGGAPLTADAAVTIAAAASGEQPAASAPAPVDAAAAAAGQPSEELSEGGITVEGEVANFRPVTDPMLRNQDPGDWLMIRRNYEAWSHSPLDEIDRGNVGELELAWVWALPEGGWHAPSPIAHDGVLYLAGIGPVVQAIDARSGNLIWEHRVPIYTPGYSAPAATSPSTAISCSLPRRTPASWRSTRATARCCGTFQSPTGGTGSAIRAARSW